jgi:hypothetical protein
MGFIEIYAKSSIMINRKISVLTSVVLLFSAGSGLVYLLTDAISALSGDINEITMTPVFAPQVFDLAIVMPFTLYGAIQLLRRKKVGVLISLTTMIFFLFIGVSVVTMDVAFAWATGAEIDYGKVYSYSFISLINLILTIVVYRKLNIERAAGIPEG